MRRRQNSATTAMSGREIRYARPPRQSISGTNISQGKRKMPRWVVLHVLLMRNNSVIAYGHRQSFVYAYNQVMFESMGVPIFKAFHTNSANGIELRNAFAASLSRQSMLPSPSTPSQISYLDALFCQDLRDDRASNCSSLPQCMLSSLFLQSIDTAGEAH